VLPANGSPTAEIRQQHVVRFVGGRGLAALADQFLLFAVPLMVYRTTGSVSASGLVFLIEWLPRVLFVPVAGVLADRVDGYRLYLGADCVRALLALGAFLAVQAWPHATVVTLSVLAASMSLASAQAYIAMETTLPRFVPQEHMVRAQATIQGTEQASTVLGPAVAALLSAVLGTVDLLLATGALFALTALNMFTLRASMRRAVTNEEPTTVRGVLAAVAEGAHTLFKLPAMVGLVGLTMMVNLMVGVGMATSAAITTGTFGKSDRYFGVLSFAEGVLSLLIFFVIPRLSRRISPLVAILGTFVIICLGGLTISQASTFTQFVIGYVLLIGTVGILNVFIRAERIRRIPREHLGKTIGLIVLLNQISLPISGLVVATFARTHGPQTVVFGSVLGSVLITVLLLPLVLQLRYPDANPDTAPNHRRHSPVRGRHRLRGPRRDVYRYGRANGDAACAPARHAD
jgi:MFS family permease